MIIDWPVGTPEERAAASDGLPGAWEDDNPYLNRYRFGYHTGADLNLNRPSWNADAGSPVYAIADGEVVFSALGAGKTWAWIIILKHTREDGSFFCSRYAHENHKAFAVPAAGDTVKVGQQIALVGNADGYYSPGGDHLHWDVSLDDTLLKDASDWPGLDAERVRAHYAPPIDFVIAAKKLGGKPLTLQDVTATDTLNIRALPDRTSTRLGGLPKGAQVRISQDSVQNGYVQLADRPGWILQAYCAPALPEVVQRWVSADAVPYLRVRSEPSKTAPIIGQLLPGAAVHVNATSVQNGYLSLADTPGWLYESYLVDWPPVAPKATSRAGLHYMPGGNNAALLDMLRATSLAGKPIRGVKLVKMGGGFSNGLQVADVKEASPSTEVVLRPLFDDWEARAKRSDINWDSANLYDAGLAFGHDYYGRFIVGQADNQRADYHQVICEPGDGDPNPAGWASFWQGALDAVDGVKLVVGCFSVFHPPLPGEQHGDGSPYKYTNFWQNADVLTLLRRVRDGGHALGLDEYIYPDPGGKWTDANNILRHQQVYGNLLTADLKGLKLIVLELGTEKGAQTGEAQYMAGLAAWDKAVAVDAYLAWAALWTDGGGGTWTESLLDSKIEARKRYFLSF